MNEQPFHVGDYVETNTGDRGTILSIELHLTTGLYTAYLDHDGGTKGTWLVRDLTKVSERADAIKAGYMSDWDVSLTRPPQDMVSAWRLDVTNGDTWLGYDAWLAERTEDDVRDYEVSIANTFPATSEQDAVRQFVAYLTDPSLTYTVRESYADGSFGSEYYVDLDDDIDPESIMGQALAQRTPADEAVKVFGPGGLLEYGKSID